MRTSGKVSPVDSSIAARQKAVQAFWRLLEVDGEIGAATWEVLDRLKEKVKAAMLQRPPDLRQAESLTAKAALLIIGIR